MAEAIVRNEGKGTSDEKENQDTMEDERRTVVEEERSWKDSVRTAAFVIGTALIIFVAARNTVTWHLQKVWGVSGDFWQSQWDKVYDWFQGDPLTMGVYGTIAITMSVFWFFNSLLLILDVFEKPAFLRKYKVQDTMPLERKKLWRAIWRVLSNQLLVGAPVVYVAYHLMLWRGASFDRELPSFHWVVFELFVMIWTEEIFFYYSHRLGHHPLLYKHIHKIHHEWTAPIGLVALYAHPVEHVVSNLMPPMLGPLLCGCHVTTAWMWFSMALVSTSIAHSGYHFPFFPSPEAHDFHHLKFNQNYGVLGVLDRLHGTDGAFRKSKAYERHFLLLSLVPVKELIPEDQKKNQ